MPIILVGCKKDLRYDPKVIEELRKTSQKPVSPEEVCILRFRVICSFSCPSTLSLPSPPSQGHMSKQPSSALHDRHTLVVSRTE